jgi:hypothetical protein
MATDRHACTSGQRMSSRPARLLRQACTCMARLRTPGYTANSAPRSRSMALCSSLFVHWRARCSGGLANTRVRANRTVARSYSAGRGWLCMVMLLKRLVCRRLGAHGEALHSTRQSGEQYVPCRALSGMAGTRVLLPLSMPLSIQVPNYRLWPRYFMIDHALQCAIIM